MHPSVVRHIHARNVFHAIRLRPHMSQREIAEKAGTDKSTVSAIIHDFEALGLIERSQGVAPRRPGRPGERIAISAKGGLLVGVHPRPGEVRYKVAGLDGETIGDVLRPLPDEPDALGDEFAAGIEAVVESIGRRVDEVRAVGLPVQGLVSRTGDIAQSPNLNWRDIPLRRIVERSVRLPLYIDNNANAAALAERMFGAAVDAVDFIYVESGSGVGCGVFLDGGLYRGADGFAGEFGHTKIYPHGRLCRCGSSGCLSAYASILSIIQRLQQKGLAVATPTRASTAATILPLVDQPVVREALGEAGQALGLGLANLINLLNPPLIILGGGFAELAPFMMPAVQAALDEAALPSALAGCRIEVSTISTAPLSRGGIALALDGCTSLHETEATPW